MADDLEIFRCPNCYRKIGRFHHEGNGKSEIKCSCNWFTLVGSSGIIRTWDGRKEKAA